jgi:AraC family transcriptional regulator
MTNPTLTGRADAVVARVERKTYSPHARLSRHVHADARILCVVAGGFTERVGRHQFECAPGMVLVRGPGEPHANDYGPRGAKCVAITISGARLASDPLLGNLFATPNAFPRSPANLATRIDLELSRGDRAASLAIEGLALELVSYAVRRAEAPTTRVVPKCLRDAHALFEAEFTTAVRVADVAAAVGIHPVYLARAFRTHFGYSPSELVRLRRLENAARMLRETSRAVSEIAFENGFASQSHFSTSFVNHNGCTPSAYRVGAGGTGV